MKKITQEDITEEQLVEARNIIHDIVKQQTVQFPLELGYATLERLFNADPERDTRLSIHSSLFYCLDLLYSSLRSSLYSSLDSSLDSSLHSVLYRSLDSSLDSSLRSSLRSSLYSGLHSSLRSGLRLGLIDDSHSSLSDTLREKLDSESLKVEFVGIYQSFWLAYFSIAKTFGVHFEDGKLEKLRDFCLFSPTILYVELEGERVPIICPKPTKIKWVQTGETQDEFKLPTYEIHADGESAIEILGQKTYVWHNAIMPKKYGSVHSSKWRAEWFAEETNVELKRILAEQIGYERICKELNGKKLDSWREYILYRFENVDIEPMHILKMTCPSTGHQHYGRVPPDCFFARDAATARNHGIDPEQFLIEH